MINKIFLNFSLLMLLFACSGNDNAKNSINNLPSWYVSPKQNNAASIYGVGDGFTLEEATKSALADAAARLIVAISSQSTLQREEIQITNGSKNTGTAIEESRQQIKQNIEKIEFTNFSVSNSQQSGSRVFVEITMSRQQFILAQQEKLSFLDRQIFDLNKNISSQNLVQKQSSLIKILDLAKQAEILARILQNSEGNKALKSELSTIANAQNELNNIANKVEFYFEIKSSSEISAIIRTALNKEKIKIAKTESESANQVKLAINSSKSSGEIYGAKITKIKIDFENKSAGKVIASNSIEVSGSSVLGEKESYAAALESLKDKINQDGILKILGIL